MKARTKDAISLGVLFIVAIVFLYVLSQAFGCAAGKGPGGEIIIGFKVGELAETGNELATQAGRVIGTAVGGPLGGNIGEMLAQGALAVLGVGGAAAAIRQTKKRGQAEVAAAVAKAENGKV